MRTKTTGLGLLVVFSFCFMAGCSGPQRISLWERHCAACHDGKTVLNGKVVPAREQMTARYRTIDEFADACAGAPVCMNIVKHEEKLLREVGAELGLKK